jgi:hypothetical protein
VHARRRPPYTSRQSELVASAEAIIVRIGVMPIPPAMNRYFADEISGKLLRGLRIRTWTRLEGDRERTWTRLAGAARAGYQAATWHGR